jgi:protocatechuate 3,4-dioxygenase, alpha subunit
MRLAPTAEMTLGPFFPHAFADGANQLGEAIEISGRITQADGQALPNVIVEIWQADAAGRFDNPDFQGWGRAATDAQGTYRFRSVKPGACAGRAPHINFLILYSGLMRQLQTVMFFEDGNDPVLKEVPEREKLIARKESATSYRFDIRLRGEGETPFFDD